MAVTADRVIVELEAKVERYNAKVADAERRFNTATVAMQRSAGQMERSIQQNSGAIGNSLRGLAGAFAAAFSIQQVQQLADGYTRFVNQLRVAGLEGENLSKVQQRLFDTAQRNGVALESLGTLYSRSAQVSRELGASQEDLLRFTSGVAAALRIQGTSATEAQGALLQLSQALGSGTVRAEEFNSINEGALPILQAVARHLDAAGGSVARLKTLVNNGQLSSEAFFQAFLAGTADLEAQASRASLTIGNAFTVLNNALGVYIGQTDDGLSATERISGAIIALSENLDKVALALGVLATVLLGRFAAAMVAAAASTGAVTTAIFAMQARAAGAATTMEALAFTGGAAGRSLLAAFGGPVGAAVSALAVGIYYLSSVAADARTAIASLEGGLDQARTKLQEARDRAQEAGVAVGVLREETAGASPVMLGIAHALDVASAAARTYAESAQAAAIASARLRLVQARENVHQLEGWQAARGRPGPTYGIYNAMGPSNESLAAGIAAGRTQIPLIQQEIDLLSRTPAGAFRDSGGHHTAAAAGAGHHAGGHGRSGPDPDEIQRRFLSDLDRLQTEFLQARLQITTDAEDRAEILRQLAQHEYDARLADINNTKEYTEEHKRQLRAELNRNYGRDEQGNLYTGSPIAEAINREMMEQQARELHDVRAAQLDAEVDALTMQERLADTQAERREIQNRLLDAEIARLQLELDSLQTWQTHEREIAQARLDAARAARPANQEQIRRDTAGPGEHYLDDLRRAGATMNEAFQGVAVDGLQSLNDGLVEAITGAKSLGEVFKNVANQIIADLLRIAIQQMIIKPLANALFAGGGGFGLPGFATGGSFTIGGHTGSDRNVLSINGVPAARVSRGERVAIIPQGRTPSFAGGAATSRGARVTVISAPQFDLRGVVTTPALMREIERVSQAHATAAAAAMGRGVLQAVPGRLTQFQSDGL